MNDVPLLEPRTAIFLHDARGQKAAESGRREGSRGMFLRLWMIATAARISPLLTLGMVGSPEQASRATHLPGIRLGRATLGL